MKRFPFTLVLGVFSIAMNTAPLYAATVSVSQESTPGAGISARISLVQYSHSVRLERLPDSTLMRVSNSLILVP